MLNFTEYPLNGSRNENASDIVTETNTVDNTSVVSDEEVECGKEIEDTVSEYLWKIVPPILFCIGITGNILTIIVIRKLGFRRQPTLTFLLCLAINDGVVLCTGLPRYWINYVFDYDLRAASNANCKLYFFFIYLTMQYSSWILVGVTLERLIKIYFPFKYRRIYSCKKVLVVLFVTLCVLILVNGHFFFTNGINDYTEGDCGSLNDAAFYFDENVFIYIDFTILSVLPFIVMLVCNILLVKALRNVQRERLSMMHRSVYQRTNRFSVKMTKMLVVCTFYFLIATAPVSIYFILDTYLLPGYEASGNCLSLAKMDLAWSITYLIQFSNYCINFYLYTAMNDRFFKVLKDVICCRKSSRMMRVYSTQRGGSSGRRLATSARSTTIGLDFPVSEEEQV